VYSACTFSREENEGVVEEFLRRHGDMGLIFSRRLYPHTCHGEGHFVARMEKAGNGGRPQPPMRLTPCREAAYQAFLEDTYHEPPPGQAYALKDGRVLLLNGELPEGLGRLRLLSAGICAGELKNGRFQPGHGLFMAARPGELRRRIMPEAEELREYFLGNTLAVEEGLRGWCGVCVDNWCLGFGKAVEGTLKNHLPKGLRIY